VLFIGEDANLTFPRTSSEAGLLLENKCDALRDAVLEERSSRFVWKSKIEITRIRRSSEQYTLGRLRK
jgi:hypothetical protein